MRTFPAILALLFQSVAVFTQDTFTSTQPQSGPGGMDYLYGGLRFYDDARDADGFWLFEPDQPQPDSADVIVFLHGYGAYNPFVYGKWIKHLVAKGNIVIYPRYQKNLLVPGPDAFPETAAAGIRNALALMQQEGHVRPRTGRTVYIGHSYGGVIGANLAVNWEPLDVPRPAALMLCAPGTGPLKGARLESYAGLPPDLDMLVVVSEDDQVVGDGFGKLVFESAVNTPNRNLVIQLRDTSSTPAIGATHSEPYAYDLEFDSGMRNYTTRRVLEVSKVDEVDFYCYWKLTDALMAFSREGQFREVAFGNTPAQRFMGIRPDGRNVRELEVILPDAGAMGNTEKPLVKDPASKSKP